MISGYAGSESALIGHLSTLLAAKDRDAASVSDADGTPMTGARDRTDKHIYRAGVEALVKEGEWIGGRGMPRSRGAWATSLLPSLTRHFCPSAACPHKWDQIDSMITEYAGSEDLLIENLSFLLAVMNEVRTEAASTAGEVVAEAASTANEARTAAASRVDEVRTEAASTANEVRPEAAPTVDQVVAEAASMSDEVVAEAASTAEEVQTKSASSVSKTEDAIDREEKRDENGGSHVDFTLSKVSTSKGTLGTVGEAQHERGTVDSGKRHRRRRRPQRQYPSEVTEE